MTPVGIIGLITAGLVFFFGAILSLLITGGYKTWRSWTVFVALCVVFLALMTWSWLRFGLDFTKRM